MKLKKSKLFATLIMTCIFTAILSVSAMAADLTETLVLDSSSTDNITTDDYTWVKSTGTLTILNDTTITVYGGYGIEFTSTGTKNIVLNANLTIIVTDTGNAGNYAGIYNNSTSAGVTISGEGDLNINCADNYAIYCAYSPLILNNSGTVTLGGASYGIYSSANAVTLQGTGDVTITAGTYGIYARGGITIDTDADVSISGNTAGLYGSNGCDIVIDTDGTLTIDGGITSINNSDYTTDITICGDGTVNIDSITVRSTGSLDLTALSDFSNITSIANAGTVTFADDTDFTDVLNLVSGNGDISIGNMNYNSEIGYYFSGLDFTSAEDTDTDYYTWVKDSKTLTIIADTIIIEDTDDGIILPEGSKLILNADLDITAGDDGIFVDGRGGLTISGSGDVTINSSFGIYVSDGGLDSTATGTFTIETEYSAVVMNGYINIDGGVWNLTAGNNYEFDCENSFVFSEDTNINNGNFLVLIDGCIKVYGDMTLPDVTYYGETIIFDDGATLTVEAGTEIDLTSYTDIWNSTYKGVTINTENGTLIVEGTLILDAEIYNDPAADIAAMNIEGDGYIVINDVYYSTLGKLILFPYEGTLVLKKDEAFDGTAYGFTWDETNCILTVGEDGLTINSSAGNGINFTDDDATIVLNGDLTIETDSAAFGIYAISALTITGTGAEKLTVSAKTTIFSNYILKITGVEFDLTASSKGIEGESVTITDCTGVINSVSNSITTENDKDTDNISITNSSLELYYIENCYDLTISNSTITSDYTIWADNILEITNSTVSAYYYIGSDTEPSIDNKSEINGFVTWTDESGDYPFTLYGTLTILDDNYSFYGEYLSFDKGSELIIDENAELDLSYYIDTIEYIDWTNADIENNGTIYFASEVSVDDIKDANISGDGYIYIDDVLYTNAGELVNVIDGEDDDGDIILVLTATEVDDMDTYGYTWINNDGTYTLTFNGETYVDAALIITEVTDAIINIDDKVTIADGVGAEATNITFSGSGSLTTLVMEVMGDVTINSDVEAYQLMASNLTIKNNSTLYVETNVGLINYTDKPSVSLGSKIGILSPDDAVFVNYSVYDEEYGMWLYYGVYTTDGEVLADDESNLAYGISFGYVSNSDNNSNNSSSSTTTTTTTTEEETVETVFEDVVEGSYYADAVAWAVENGITNGTGETTFGTGKYGTREDVVTFLWRLAGEPEAEDSDSEFTDIVDGAYYYTAVLWAKENGITAGINDDEFGTGVNCTRAQIVTFLWRLAGEPEAEVTGEFSDVADDAYYETAVAWAVENGITNGTGNSTFSSDDNCKREDIVTFMYRYAVNVLGE